MKPEILRFPNITVGVVCHTEAIPKKMGDFLLEMEMSYEKVSLEDPPENHSNNPIPRDQISKSRVQTVLYQAILEGSKPTEWKKRLK